MRRKEREIGGLSTIVEWIEKAEVCRLGLVDRGKPYVVPVNCVFLPGDPIGTLYFHSAPRGRKIDVLAAAPQVCIEIDFPRGAVPAPRPCDAGYSYVSLIGMGEARRCGDPDEIRLALGLFAVKFLQKDYVYSDREIAGTAVFAVTLTEITGKSSG